MPENVSKWEKKHETRHGPPLQHEGYPCSKEFGDGQSSGLEAAGIERPKLLVQVCHAS